MSWKMYCTTEKDVVIPLDDLTWNSLKKRVDDTPLTDSRAQQATIFRVPDNIRATDSKAYEPKIVSLGPYHYPDERLREWGDKLKWRYFKKFLARNPHRGLDDYRNLIQNLEPEARNAYSEELNMSRNDFVQMLLLDCCFVIELLLVQMEEKKKTEEKLRKTKQAMEEKKKEMMMMKQVKQEEGSTAEQDPIISVWKWALPLLAHDMMTFENQLPLFVLESLIELADPNVRMSEPIHYFFRNFPLSSGIKDVPDDYIKHSHHLLHLFHRCIVPAVNRGGNGRQPIFLDQPSVPCARELREARVKIRRNKAAASFLDITFQGGRMEIPQLRIDDEANALLRNLIAFEQCYTRVDDHVTTYGWFMDSVIDTEADVATLRRREVIVSGLGSDEDVGLLFNKLCKEVTIDFHSCYLAVVLEDVKKHCDNKCNKWWASLKHTYFHNPWTSISLFAALPR